MFVLSTVAVLSAGANAQDGGLDATFGTDGLVEIALPSLYAEARSVAIDHHGRIVVAGGAITTSATEDFALFRLQPDGALDATYAIDGDGFRFVDFDLDGIGGYSIDFAQDVHVFDDDSVVAAGEAHFGLSGYNSQYALVRTGADGGLDSTFGHGGSAHFGFDTFMNDDQATLLRLDTLGRGVVCGTVTFGEPVNVWAGLARLTTQGSFDSTFYGYGRYDAPLYADKSTDPPTIAVDNVPSALVLDSAERIVVTGTFFEPFAPDVAVMRTDTDGKYDPGFGSQGIGRVRLQLPNAVAGDVVPLPEGKLMVSGDYYTTAQIPFLFRLNEDGSPDSTFGSAGLASGAPIDAGHAAQFTFLARTKNGGWLLAGAYLVNDNLLYPPAGVIVVRFRADGSIDTAFADNGVATITPDTGSRPFAANRAALQPDGRLVVAGWMPSTNAPNDPTRNFAVVRILADYDTLFVDGFDPAP